MAEEHMLPIKVVLPRDIDYRKPSPSGGGPTVFGEVTAEVRGALASNLQNVNSHFASTFRRFPEVPAVAKVILKPEAVAKSHRPTDLFNETTCPIIGANSLGELYISVRPERVDLVTRRLEGLGKKTEANISTVAQIQPFTVDDVLRSQSIETIVSEEQNRSALRFRLFRHGSPRDDSAIEAAFLRMVREYKISEVERIDYARSLCIYRLQNVPEEVVGSLAGFVGIQSLSLFPAYSTVETMSRTLGPISPSAFPPPEPGKEYGVVGIIDTGTDPNNSHLQAWVEDRYELVPRGRQNNEHGSFVAGLIAQGRRLNHNDERFPRNSCRIIDVVALEAQGIQEDELIVAIDQALTRYPQVRVWNLSLGLNGQPCGDNEFSELGTALDERAIRHNVLFVIAAGNYIRPPLRTWPPQHGLGDEDRICPPADSILGLTVGSVAHRQTASTRVREQEPSPFSRRGPGPAYVMKPELVHIGGNCDGNLGYAQTGVISVNGSGQLAENIGTSFACPLVAATAGSAFLQLAAGHDLPAPPLVKALLIHSAFMRNNALENGHVNYQGLGCPADADETVQCMQSEATVIFQIPVTAGLDFGKRPFPMPASLAVPEKGLQAEIFMTLLYAPPLDRAFGIEYCRTNISASLGTISINADTGMEHYTRQVFPVPESLASASEPELVKNGYKWSPLKLYYRKFSRGPVGHPWRLSLELISRAETPLAGPQDVLIIITLRAKNPQAPVYNELVRDMNRLNWGAQDLALRSQTRMRV